MKEVPKHRVEGLDGMAGMGERMTRVFMETSGKRIII